MIRKLLIFLVFLPVSVFAQGVGPLGARTATATATISPTTPTSGCTNGAVLYSGYTAGNFVRCNGPTFNDASLALTLSAATSPLIFPSATYATFGSASFLGDSGAVFTGGTAGDLGVRGSTNLWLGVGNNPYVPIATGGATTIGGSALSGTTVPLTVNAGGSTGNIANFGNTALGASATSLSGTGVLTVGLDSGIASPNLILRDTGSSVNVGLANANGALFFLTAGTTPIFGFQQGYFQVASDAVISWNSATNYNSGTEDVALGREAAAILQMGRDVNGSPVNQTFKSHDGITGTNISGANLTLAAGRGTGTGAGGDLIFQTAPIEASGTTAQTLITRATIPKTGGILHAAVLFANLGTPSNGTQIYCSDCQQTTPYVDTTCATGGTGAIAFRLNGAWKCFN